MPNNSVPIISIRPTLAASAGMRSSDRRMIGFSARNWVQMIATKPIADSTASRTIRLDSNHCSRCPSSSSTVRQPSARDMPDRPSQSALRNSRQSGATLGKLSISSVPSPMQTGRLMKKE